MRPLHVLLLAALPLAGCATTEAPQPPKPDPWTAAMQKAAAESKACFDRVTNEKRFAHVRAEFIGVSGATPTAAMLRNRGIPTAQDGRMVLDYGKAIEPCREILYNAAAAKPRYAHLLKLYYAKNDAVAMAVARRQVRWGRANTLIKRNTDEFKRDEPGAFSGDAGQAAATAKAPKCVVVNGSTLRCNEK